MMNRLDASRSNHAPPVGALGDQLGLAPHPAWRPYLMGAVAATPDCARRARQLIDDGANIVNVVGFAQSQVVQAVSAIAAIPGAVVTVDTADAEIAGAAAAAGATVISAEDSSIADLALQLDGLCAPDSPERAAAGLAALSAAIDSGAAIVRTDDVAGAADFMKVRAALNGQLEVDAGLMLAENKRRVN